jgi:glucose/arabinose dehydrogenase
MKKFGFVICSLLWFAMLLSACSPSAPIVKPGASPTSAPQPFPVNSPQPSFNPPTRIVTTATSQPVAESAPIFPDAGMYLWKPIAGGFKRPVSLANAGDGSGRLFVVEQAGLIRVIHQNNIRSTPFLDISSQVGSTGSEQGLLGLAFHPRFKENGFFYVNYTDLNGNTVIARFTADLVVSVENQTANPASELILLRVKQPFPNHNGGQMAIGLDKMLWIGLGDGGSAGDPNGNGQSVQTLLGKILRIDIDHGSPYAIPADNPFAAGGGLPEIWAYGLRNPWRFTFDSQTGDLFIADVGQNLWEEIDYLPAGFKEAPANFGWNLREGMHPYKNTGSNPSTILIDPVFEYGHDQGCSVTGGEIYRGQSLPAFKGIYLFGDYCSGKIWGLIRQKANQWRGQILFNTGLNITSFGTDETREVYLLDMNTGLYRLQVQ